MPEDDGLMQPQPVRERQRGGRSLLDSSLAVGDLVTLAGIALVQSGTCFIGNIL